MRNGHCRFPAGAQKRRFLQLSVNKFLVLLSHLASTEFSTCAYNYFPFASKLRFKVHYKPLYRLGQLSQKVDFCRQIRGKVGKHTFLDENYALKTKILFTKLGSAILTFN